MLSVVFDVLGRVATDVWGAFWHNWPYLLASALTAAALSVYVGTDRLAGWMRRKRWTAITGAVLLATLTPFCSCGTTAIVLGMLATKTPWAPIVAFMVASPLTSPSELVLSAGLFGWPFALLYFAGATGLGFAAGGVAGLVEDRGLLVGQARLRAAPGGCGEHADRPTGVEADARQPGAGCGTGVAMRTKPSTRPRAWWAAAESGHRSAARSAVSCASTNRPWAPSSRARAASSSALRPCVARSESTSRSALGMRP